MKNIFEYIGISVVAFVVSSVILGTIILLAGGEQYLVPVIAGGGVGSFGTGLFKYLTD